MAEQPQDFPITLKAVIAPILGWAIPGAGHFFLGKWVRGLLLGGSVLCMFVLGLWMQGQVYSPNTGDLLDILGFVGDAGNGAPYLLARLFEWGHGAINLATADYGSKFIIVAGLLNIVSAVDAHHIALGKKE